MDKTFKQWKKQSLQKLDMSKKGSVDQDIEHLVSLLNGREEYFTTSSCSGRVIMIDAVRWEQASASVLMLYDETPMIDMCCVPQAPESSDVQKQNCVWLFVSHQKCTSDDLVSSVGPLHLWWVTLNPVIITVCNINQAASWLFFRSLLWPSPVEMLCWSLSHSYSMFSAGGWRMRSLWCVCVCVCLQTNYFWETV